MGKKLFFKLYIALIMIFFALMTGVVGYMYIEDFTLLESLYMTIITISTVGFEEVRDLSEHGKIFTIFLIVTNIGIFTYSITTVSSYILDGDFQKHYKTFKLKKNIEKLKNHVVVCGYGRNGSQTCKDLAQHGIPFVIIDVRDEVVEFAKEKGYLIIHGDATQDKSLVEAGLHHAQALISTLPTDADNVFVVLTAKRMNTGLKVISRATDDSSEQKLKSAGAESVIMPEKIGGSHMASLITKPDVIEFVDIVTGQGQPGANIDEMNFEALKDEFKNKSLRELDVKNITGANIIGFKNSENEYIINPSSDMVIEPGSRLLVLGSKEQILKLKQVYLGAKG